MKINSAVLLMLFLLNIVATSGNSSASRGNSSSTEYRDITDYFSMQKFENIKTFILENGDRQTYCVMYGNNPHYSFSGFEAYLNPEIGQKNIGCDPTISDFNQIVIKDVSASPQYYCFQIVRKGDTGKESIHIVDGMNEERVYLPNSYNNDMDSMESNVKKYLAIIEGKTAATVFHPPEQLMDNVHLFFSPATQQLVVNVQTVTNENVRIRIFDVRGKVVLQQRIIDRIGICHVAISVSQLPRGFYTGRLANAGNVGIFSFLKN